MFNSCCLGLIFLGILVAPVGCHFGCNIVFDAFGHTIRIGEKGPELLVEGCQDIAQIVYPDTALRLSRVLGMLVSVRYNNRGLGRVGL